MSEKYAPSWLEEIYLQKHMSENAVSNLGILHSDFVFSNVSSVELTQKSRTPHMRSTRLIGVLLLSSLSNVL